MSSFLRIGDVSKKTAMGKSTIWLWVKQKKFPEPSKISKRITVWTEEEIDMWMKQKLV